MNATLGNAPLRPDTDKVRHLLGDHVIVTEAWYVANEAQLRHITEAALSAERERDALKRRLDECQAQIQHSKTA